MTALNDFQPGQKLDGEAFAKALTNYREAARACDPVQPLRAKLDALLGEVEELFEAVENGDLDRLGTHLRRCKHLFRGTAGLGMNFYIGFKG